MPADIYVIPFSHMDLFWLGDQEDCLSRGNRIISQAMQIASSDRDFCFLVEDAVFVKNFLETHPEQRSRLKDLVAMGRIEVGPKWAGIYQNSQGGEDLVRNTLYAKQFLREELEIDTAVINFGDLPGFTPQFPQILAKSCVRHAIVSRCGPSATPLFHWRAPDGSSTLTWYSVKAYTWGLDLGLHDDVDAARLTREVAEVSALTPAPVLMHWGIDLVVPNEKLCHNVRRWNGSNATKMKLDTPSGYFKEAEQHKDLPVLSGEAPRVWWPRDGRCVHVTALGIPATNALLAAEKFATVASLMGLVDYPRAKLKDLWCKLLQGMDHNYNGQGGLDGDRRKAEYHIGAIRAGNAMLRDSLARIAENVEVLHGPACNPIVVFNVLSWARSDIVEAHVTFHGDLLPFDIKKFRDVVLKDENGDEVPFQYVRVRDGIARDAIIAFLAKDIPSIGYGAYYLVPGSSVRRGSGSCEIVELEEDLHGAVPTRKEILVLENDFVVVRMNRLTGAIDITDKSLGRPMVVGARLLAVEERTGNYHVPEETGRVFENAVESVMVEENGEVRTRVAIVGRIRGAVVRQEIVLYRELRRIDFVDTIFWEESHPLKVQQVFPVQANSPDITYGTPYGSNPLEKILPDCGPVRPDELPRGLWSRSRDIQKWIDVGNGIDGLTICSADTRSVEIEGALVRFNLVWGTESPFCRTVDADGGDPRLLQLPPPGEYTLAFSLYPHAGTWRESKAYRRGWERADPLRPISSNDPVTSRTLPPRKSFCALSEDNIVVTVLKKSEIDEMPVIRGYEAEGRSARSSVTFFKPVCGLTETNLLEDEQKSIDGATFECGKCEIKTLRLLL